MKKINRCVFVITLFLLGISCKKNDAPLPVVPKVTTGLYVLSEGSFNQNNTTLTYYNTGTATATTDFFENTNQSKLGDTGNDMIIYGGKLYIVMNVSSYVEVADALTGKELKKIAFKTDAGVARQPRYALGYKNKVLVSAYDGTVAVIDTAALTIDKSVTVGPNPEQMAVYGDKLYVANSGGLNPVYDSTVSVVDLNSLTEIQKIVVGINPGSIAADDAGNIYIGCTGDYGANGPKLVKINAMSGTVITSADSAVGKIRFFNGLLYVTGGYLGSPYVRTLSATDFKATSNNFITDGTLVQQPYGLNIDSATGDVYITDAVDYISSGKVFCFDKTGKRKFSFSVAPGLNPNTVVPIKQ